MGEEKELKDQRIPIMMTETEVAAIDDWSFKHRIRSRGEAIRRLCQIGLIFDDRRADLVSQFRDLVDKTADTTSAASELLRREGATGSEVKLSRAALAAMSAAFKLLPLIQTTTGLANNFKSDRDIEEIMAEAKEILAIDDEELEEIINGNDIVSMAKVDEVSRKKKPES